MNCLKNIEVTVNNMTNKEIVKAMYDVIFNSHNLDRAAVADIYRFENGKAAEHWDVLQTIPPEFVHDNGMF